MANRLFQGREPNIVSEGWEIPLLVATGLAVMLALAALLGLAAASALFGHGWVWPAGDDIIRTLGGLLAGQPGRGLPPDTRSAMPNAHIVYGCVAVTELGAVAVATSIGVVYARNRVPTDARGGMASRREAGDVLGARRLRKAAAVIRPDLYCKETNRGRKV
jgi:hypothetical protein